MFSDYGVEDATRKMIWFTVTGVMAQASFGSIWWVGGRMARRY